MKKIKIPAARFALVLTIFIGSVFMVSCNNDAKNDEADPAACISTPVDLKLNNGNFYLNGFTDSAYFTVKDGTIQLITDDKDKLREAYHALSVAENINHKKISTNTTGRGSPEKFEEWYDQMCREWEKPDTYMLLFNQVFEKNHIALNWGYESDGTTISFYTSMDYIDEDNLEWGEGVRFTRIEED